LVGDQIGLYVGHINEAIWWRERAGDNRPYAIRLEKCDGCAKCVSVCPADAIERLDDTTASQPGAGLGVWAETSTGCLLGADRAGAPRRSAEAIGRRVARALLEDLAAHASVDRYLADQLVLFAVQARGRTRYRVPADGAHLRTNLWLAERFGAGSAREGSRVEIDGLGLRP